MFSKTRSFFMVPGEVAAGLKQVSDQIEGLTNSIITLIDRQAADLKEITASVDAVSNRMLDANATMHALTNRLSAVETHMQQLRGSFNSRSNTDTHLPCVLAKNEGT